MSQIVGNYVKSCQYCQKRKISRASTKSSITSYPTPAKPFEVWEIGLYGPLPVSKQGSSYIVTAIDMFNKYVVAYPIKSKDAVTVAQALFKLITHFGVCNTIISDQGSEFNCQSYIETLQNVACRPTIHSSIHALLSWSM